MIETQFGGVQEQADKSVSFSKGNVLARIAVRRIADDRVIDSGQVSSQLMPPSGPRREIDERVPSGWIGSSRVFELAVFERPEMGFRSLGLLASRFAISVWKHS